MAVCPACGAENSDRAKYCGECAAPLGAQVERDIRKTVTVLFADIAGSTTLAGRLDPEAMRALMTRYFDMSRRVIERHGGTVEKFIGDAVVGVFGVPLAHEDDAMRAARAAVELRDSLGSVDARLSVRIGVNTGEVIAGDPTSGQTFVTGDAVNLAARLHTYARPGQVLAGSTTAQLLRGRGEVRHLETRAIEGFADPAEVWEIGRLTVLGDRAPRVAAFVGRARELSRIRQAYDDAVADRRAHLFTLLGTAGVGKSRLIAEFADGLDPAALVLRGRCLSYGEGITYWAVAEAIRMAAAITEDDTAAEARQALRALLDGHDAERVARIAGAAIGLSIEHVGQTEIAWAIRRVFENIASSRPLVIVFEDIHWAEPTFLDILEQFVEVSRGYSILVICPARPELLDIRPAWGGGKLNTTTMLLEPLSENDAERLIDIQPGGSAVPGDLRRRISDAAEGNPLFVEEMIGMLIDDGVLTEHDGEWLMRRDTSKVTVPPTIRALLGARLDRLMADERAIAMGASVAGRVFEEGAALELVPREVRPAVPAGLLSLVRKELIRPDHATITAGEAYKFRHILIRDAAYEALPKSERSDLHERFAAWLTQAAGDRLTEYEEVLGYHLEQAYRYRVELGHNDEPTKVLAERAGAALGAAGMRARQRQDANAAMNLLARAAELVSETSANYEKFRLGRADALLFADRASEATQILKDVVETSTDPAVVAEARLLLLNVAREKRPIPKVEVRAELASILRSIRHTPGHHRLRAHAIGTAADVSMNEGDVLAAMRAYRIAYDIGQRSGERALAAATAFWLASNGLRNPMPLAQVREICEEVLKDPDLPFSGRASTLSTLGVLMAMQGNVDDGRRMLDEAGRVRDSVGLYPGGTRYDSGVFHSFAGEYELAAREFRAAIEVGERLDLASDIPWIRARLAHALASIDRDPEAWESAQRALAEGWDNIWSQTIAGSTIAKIMARQGKTDESVERAKGVIAAARAHKLELLPYIFGMALEDLAFVLSLAGRRDEAAVATREALELYRQKGMWAWASRAEASLSDLAGDGDARPMRAPKRTADN